MTPDEKKFNQNVYDKNKRPHIDAAIWGVCSWNLISPTIIHKQKILFKEKMEGRASRPLNARPIDAPTRRSDMFSFYENVVL